MRRLLVLVSLTLAVAACSDTGRTPTAPGAPVSRSTILPCDPVQRDTLREQAADLLVDYRGHRTAALSQLTNIDRACPTDRPSAQAQVRALEAFMLRDLADGELVDREAGGLTLQAHVASFLNGLYEFSGLALGGAGVATPSSAVTVTTVDQTAGISIPAGAVSQEVIIIITPLPDNTQLPNNPYTTYPPVVDITTNIGPIVFAVPATVGLCESDDVPSGVQPNLRIVHGLANNTTEVLPLAPPPSFLDCYGPLSLQADPEKRFDLRDPIGTALHGVRWAGAQMGRLLLPTPLYAIHGGLGGLTTSLSPFVAADVGSVPIAFSSNRDSTLTVPVDVFTMNPDGTNQTRIVSNGVHKLQPAWSPDRSKIAFAGWVTTTNLEIYVMNADGTNVQQLTTATGHDLGAAWSPDGTKIAFHSNRDGNTEIYVMNADGTGQTRLTTDAASDAHPTWSPDGTKIAFGSDRVGATFQIFTMNSNGTGQTQLTFSPLVKASPEWSPTGGKIVFEGFVGFVNIGDIWVMNADGTGETQLTTDAADDRQPDWNPIGTKIVFRSMRDGNAEIYVMNPNGTGQTRLTTDPGIDQFPSWR